MKMNGRRVLEILAVTIIVTTVLTYAVTSSYFSRQIVVGKVKVTGSPSVIVNPSILDFGNMTANHWKILNINITNTGNLSAHLNYSFTMGTLPPASSITFGLGIGNLIYPGTTITSPLNLTIGPAPLAGDYTFNVTITAYS